MAATYIVNYVRGFYSVFMCNILLFKIDLDMESFFCFTSILSFCFSLCAYKYAVCIRPHTCHHRHTIDTEYDLHTNYLLIIIKKPELKPE